MLVHPPVTRICQHENRIFRIVYETGMKNEPKSVYEVCLKCSNELPFNNLENIISKEMIK